MVYKFFDVGPSESLASKTKTGAARMLDINCHGSPREIGLQHGRAARSQIGDGIHFYRRLFTKYSGKDWPQILPIAERFSQNIQRQWPRFFDEIQGIAEGCGRPVVDIVALNVRTEIAFGLLQSPQRADGCTTLSWSYKDRHYLGQNWDWMEEQKENLVLLTVTSPGLPMIKMVTEAGIIGKIGLNERGVGVCLNAVRVRGLAETRLPVHLALRIALESTSARQAAQTIKTAGIAGSAHILIADRQDSISLEVTPTTFEEFQTDALGRIMHTNHILGERTLIDELPETDSFCRMARIRSLTEKLAAQRTTVSFDDFRALFDDHDGFPVSICRSQEGESEDASLFNITMDLSKPRAIVKLGRLCQDGPQFVLEFDRSRL